MDDNWTLSFACVNTIHFYCRHKHIQHSGACSVGRVVLKAAFSITNAFFLHQVWQAFPLCHTAFF